MKCLMNTVDKEVAISEAFIFGIKRKNASYIYFKRNKQRVKNSLKTHSASDLSETKLLGCLYSSKQTTTSM